MLLLAACLVSVAAAAPPAPQELVVLVHGMGRTRASMASLSESLEEAGYETVNFSYPSRRLTVAESGARLAALLDEQTARGDLAAIHMVGHSLGCIVIRWALANDPPGIAGRVVMLAPPNQGSRAADKVAPWLTWLSRPLPELTTAEGSTARSIRTPPGVPIGVIAGSRDNKVHVDETMLAGQTDHVVIGSGHSFIMYRAEAVQQTLRFLRDGQFSHTAEP